MITGEEAVEFAREALVGLATLDPDNPIETRCEGESYVVTFVHVNPPGVRGPDFDAQVTVDATSGEVTRILGAS